MNKKEGQPSETKRRLNIKEPVKRTLAPEKVADALGAEIIEGVRPGKVIAGHFIKKRPGFFTS